MKKQKLFVTSCVSLVTTAMVFAIRGDVADAIANAFHLTKEQLGLSQGLVEGVVNPLITTIYCDQKTRRLNMLHAWWPGGLNIGGLTAFAMSRVFAARGAAPKMVAILGAIPVFVFAAMLIRVRIKERQPCSGLI